MIQNMLKKNKTYVLKKTIRNNTVMFALGLGVIALLYLPMLILQENALFTMHDQLDGEVLVYIFRAAHIGEEIIPELFDGALTSAFTPASMGTLLFFYIFKPFTAFIMNYMFVALVAYTGMYLCVMRFFDKPWLAAAVSIIFSILPFYSVYGVSVMGQPLLLYACCNLYENKKKVLSYLLVAFFGLFSSLVLVGYADILLIFGFAFVISFIKKKNVRNIWFAGGILTVVYVVEYFKLLCEMLIPNSDFVSHKTEIIAGASPLVETFRNLLENGQYHAASQHKFIMYYCFILIFLLLVSKNRKLIERKYYVGFGILCAGAVGIAGFYALWKYWPIVALRNQLGGLFVSFQVDRFYWLYPCIWYLLLAFVIYFTCKLFHASKWKNILIVIMLFLITKDVYLHSSVKVNMEKLFAIQDSAPAGYQTWEAFYSEELFGEIKEYIGKPTEEYKVGSVGLYPSIALYNGFYCIDGYSNNYNLEYKHSFRKIIEKELEKNSSLKAYFDYWGNRCYLFVDQMPYAYQINKDNTSVLTEVEFDTDQLKKMGCEYLLSALPIESPYMEEKIQFCKKFEQQGSPYAIYLYKVISTTE